MTDNKTITKNDIVKGLKQLGVITSDNIIMHSSLSSLGNVDGGAKTVVDAVLEVIGSNGTLAVPAFNWNIDSFDSKITPSIVGAITEEVRNRKNAVRSLHPTHSIVAIGPLAEIICEGHEKTTAFGRGSALYKFLQANPKILQIGTDNTTNSIIHVAEEIVKVPYLQSAKEKIIKISNGKSVNVKLPGCSRGFLNIDDELSDSGEVNIIKIGNADVRLTKARLVVDTAVKMLKFDPASLLCDNADCVTCAMNRATIDAVSVEEIEKEIIEIQKEDEKALRIIESKFNCTEVEFPGFDSSDIYRN
ncbi:MAG: AAC(3) family N-acetyltransferase [Armatimonadota bacterium]